MTGRGQVERPTDWDRHWRAEPLDREAPLAEARTPRWRAQERIVRERLGGLEGLTAIEIGAGRGLNALLYAREGAMVTLELPNSETISGTVDSFEVETVDGHARAVVTVSSTDLAYGGHGGLVAPGTPISAEMKLRNDDVLARLVGSVRDFASDLKDAILR